MIAGIFNKVPHNQEIIHISHILNRIQLIGKTFFQFLRHRLIAFLQTLKTQFVQILPRGISFRHVVPRQLSHTKFNLNIAAHSDLVGVFQCLQGIRKQLCHLLRRFYEILTSLIAHTIFICQFLSCLQTQQDIMRLHVIPIRIMHIIGGCHRDSRLFMQAHQLLIDHLLLWNTMILQFQKEIVFPKDFLIAKCSRFGIFIHAFCQISGNFTRKAGTQGNDSLMILLQKLQIDTRLIIVSLNKTF